MDGALGRRADRLRVHDDRPPGVALELLRRPKADVEQRRLLGCGENALSYECHTCWYERPEIYNAMPVRTNEMLVRTKDRNEMLVRTNEMLVHKYE